MAGQTGTAGHNYMERKNVLHFVEIHFDCSTFFNGNSEKLSFYVKCLKTGIYGAFPQFFLDAQKLVVLGDTFAPAGCACLDLAGIERHGKIGWALIPICRI